MALAKALGEDPSTPAGPLMARFRSLPPNVQAGIYQRGGAQFIGGAEGSKMISGIAMDKEKHLDALTSQVAEHLASGKINYDLDGDGKPAFYEMVEDPNAPPGFGKKIKQPLNLLRQQILARGFERGTIPNPFQPQAPTSPIPVMDPTKTGKMSAEAFQQVLDARARGIDTSTAPMMTGPIPASMGIPDINPTPMSNPGWLMNGGPQRLGNEVSLDVGSAIDTVKNLAGGAANIISAPYRGAANFLLGDKVKPYTDTATFTPTYARPADAPLPVSDDLDAMRFNEAGF